MHWLFLLLAVGAFALAISTPHMWLLVLSLLAALVFLLAWIRGRYVARFGEIERDVSSMIDPLELRRLREQAELRRAERDDAGAV